MQRLVMIRHALTMSNQLGLYAGRSNDGIDAGAVNGTFRTAIQIYCRSLGTIAVQSSPRRRCLETAALVFGDQWPVAVDSRWMSWRWVRGLA
jgi:broad specificity phosphatase PhoE